MSEETARGGIATLLQLPRMAWTPPDGAGRCVDVNGRLAQSRAVWPRREWRCVLGEGDAAFSVSRASGRVWVGLAARGSVPADASPYTHCGWFVVWCPDGEVWGCIEAAAVPQVLAHAPPYAPGDCVAVREAARGVALEKNGAAVHVVAAPAVPHPDALAPVAFIGAPGVVVALCGVRGPEASQGAGE